MRLINFCCKGAREARVLVSEEQEIVHSKTANPSHARTSTKSATKRGKKYARGCGYILNTLRLGTRRTLDSLGAFKSVLTGKQWALMFFSCNDVKQQIHDFAHLNDLNHPSHFTTFSNSNQRAINEVRMFTLSWSGQRVATGGHK